MIDDTDAAVDELRRKARRRLVGAVVLALGAAILIPLLFEKDPKPLGEEVAIQIPPVDDSKFVSRLSVDSPAAAKSETKPTPPAAGVSETNAKPEPKSDAKAEPKSDAKAEPKSDAKPEAKSDAKPERKHDAKPDRKPDAKSVSKSQTKPETRSDDKSAATATAAETSTVASVAPVSAPSSVPNEPAPVSPAASADAPQTDAKPSEGYVVQLAAFTDEKGANALANRLKRAGYAAYTEPAETARGTMWRVRVGGYQSRGEAKVAAAKLRAAGHNGIVAAAK